MAPLIPNGLYKIRNGQYTNYVADLINGALVSRMDSPYNKDDKWCIRNIEPGSNQITIEHVSTPGIYASVDQSHGAPLIRSKKPTVWTIVKVDGGKYYIQSLDAGSSIGIVLVRHTGQEDTKWSFDPLGPGPSL